MLQNIRLGHTTDADLNVLLQHREVRDGIALFSHKHKAKDYNDQELDKLRSRPEPFLALDYPKDHGDNNDKHRFDKHLTLKAGMPVVLLANLDVENGLCNGSQGKLVRFIRKLDLRDQPKEPEERNYKGDSYGYEVAWARYRQISDYVAGTSGVECCEFSRVPGHPESCSHEPLTFVLLPPPHSPRSQIRKRRATRHNAPLQHARHRNIDSADRQRVQEDPGGVLGAHADPPRPGLGHDHPQEPKPVARSR
ncbi:hypothetical protein BDP81DRAFT_21940 [Colletotrichum phormii]|uniref:DNA helicase Pif1-like 2B domain-containing protein n=1 Tax=Colletotrichum phormii TaxID=359342 RepID=A0AAJ0EPH3_9PEZI|nr:uncharacterized protein BDP81DRAFT_21940 [Colletotrichum phormii]KAK1656478.1 hypothetical protein BDP81DRAFT_21940 [Colletotrichum phormii]